MNIRVQTGQYICCVLKYLHKLNTKIPQKYISAIKYHLLMQRDGTIKQNTDCLI